MVQYISGISKKEKLKKSLKNMRKYEVEVHVHIKNCYIRSYTSIQFNSTEQKAVIYYVFNKNPLFTCY